MTISDVIWKWWLPAEKEMRRYSLKEYMHCSEVAGGGVLFVDSFY